MVDPWQLVPGESTGAADSVVVDNGRTAVVSTLGGNSYTIQNLTIGSEVDGSTVEINSGVTLNVAAVMIGTGGILNLDAGGGFFQSGGFTNNGNFIVNSGGINAGPIHGTGTVTKDSAFTVTWAAPLDTGANVIVNGGTFIDDTAANGNAGVNLIVINGAFTDNTGSLANALL